MPKNKHKMLCLLHSLSSETVLEGSSDFLEARYEAASADTSRRQVLYDLQTINEPYLARPSDANLEESLRLRTGEARSIVGLIHVFQAP